MRSLVVSAALPLLLALAFPVAAQNHARHAVGAATAPIPAQRWKTDAPLREGMGRIHAAMEGLQHDELGHMSPAQAVQLGSAIERDVGFIVAHCKLEPNADAALHPIIGALIRGAQALKAEPQNLAVIPPMRSALDDYTRQFEQAGR